MAVLKYKDPTTGDIVRVPFVVGTTTPDNFDGVLPMSKGGTGASDASNARANLSTIAQPKLLWSGSATTGSTISVPGINDYTILLATFNIYYRESMSVVLNFGTNTVTAWAAGTTIDSNVRYNRMTATNLSIATDDTVSVQDTFTSFIATNGSVYAEGGNTWIPLTNIYGLILKTDMQGV